MPGEPELMEIRATDRWQNRTDRAVRRPRAGAWEPGPVEGAHDLSWQYWQGAEPVPGAAS